MDIQFERFHIMSDPMNLWIEEEYQSKDKSGNLKLDKDGNPKMARRRVAGYCGNWEQLFVSFCNRRYRASGATEAKEFVAEMNKIYQEMKDLAHKVGEDLKK